MSENPKLFALLIDGDNAQTALIPQILEAVSKYGKAVIKRIYGDWSQEQLKRWEPIASKYNFDIEHRYNASNGKNATDIALVIDAMDILHEKGDKLNGFCIVSSDSDFTHLARRIRNEGHIVLGIGKDSSQTVKDAYDEFISTESLQSKNPVRVAKPKAAEELSDNDFLKLFVKAHKQVVKKGAEDQQGRVTLREIRDLMKESSPVISSEYSQMPKFVNKVKALAEANPNIIALEEQPDSKPIAHYVHIKPAKAKTVSSEIDRFCEAYKHAAEVLKRSDKEGWVTLSDIGNILPELYPKHNPLVYRATKHSQLKKVVEKMVEDHPDVIELKISSHIAQIRIKKQQSAKKSKN